MIGGKKARRRDAATERGRAGAGWGVGFGVGVEIGELGVRSEAGTGAWRAGLSWTEACELGRGG